MKCNICPRHCNIDRSKQSGFCGANEKVKIARASRHMWEEPCISGTNGSATVFFSGCNMKCVYCQNEQISRGKIGVELTDSQLSELFLKINDSNVHNINLVTPSHYINNIISALKPIKHKLNKPIVYNCSGFESIESLELCRDIIDIFLVDIKYLSNNLSEKYSNCKDYFATAIKALDKMLEIVKKVEMNENIMTSGIIVRHLILPSHKDDSINILKKLYEMYGSEKFLVSLMCQYIPMPDCQKYPEINRHLTTMEYQKVVKVFQELGFKGYLQEKSSATNEYVPDFNDAGEFLRDFIG